MRSAGISRPVFFKRAESHGLRGRLEQVWNAAPAVAHHEACGHITAASLADLSVHCYACAAYVEHPRLTPLMQRLSALKFGEA